MYIQIKIRILLETRMDAELKHQEETQEYKFKATTNQAKTELSLTIQAKECGKINRVYSQSFTNEQLKQQLKKNALDIDIIYGCLSDKESRIINPDEGIVTIVMEIISKGKSIEEVFQLKLINCQSFEEDISAWNEDQLRKKVYGLEKEMYVLKQKNRKLEQKFDEHDSKIKQILDKILPNLNKIQKKQLKEQKPIISAINVNQNSIFSNINDQKRCWPYSSPKPAQTKQSYPQSNLFNSSPFQPSYGISSVANSSFTPPQPNPFIATSTSSNLNQTIKATNRKIDSSPAKVQESKQLSNGQRVRDKFLEALTPAKKADNDFLQSAQFKQEIANKIQNVREQMNRKLPQFAEVLPKIRKSFNNLMYETKFPMLITNFSDQFVCKGPYVRYNGKDGKWTQCILNDQFKQSELNFFAVRIVCSENRNIRIGITDVHQQMMYRYSSCSWNAICVDASNGEVKGVKHKRFSPINIGDILEVSYRGQSVQFMINNKNTAQRYRYEKLNDADRKFVPFIEMQDAGDIVQFMIW